MSALAHENPDTFPVLNPATEQVVAWVPDATCRQAAAAVDAATDAQGAWAGTAPRLRADLLRRAYDLMVRDASRLAALITGENGKSETDSMAEVLYAADYLRWYGEEAVRTDGDFGVAPSGGVRTLVTHRPVGVSALVTPWNFPAAMVTRKLAPALAAGCAVVVKPASETPLTALAIGELLTEAGVPEGVVTIVTSTDASGVVGTWLADSRVRKLSFTGSTRVGRALLAQAADRVVNTSMELGGNAPFIVSKDADIRAAVAGALTAKFRNNGQACTAANRFYVHASVKEEFVARFGAAVEALRPTSLISASARDDLAQLVEGAVQDGAVVSHQSRIPAGGWHFPATLLDLVPADARIVQTEIFGPVAPVVTWADEEELLRWANSSELGLAAYVFSGDLGWALRTAERLEAGMVGINRGAVSDPAAPFGGVKQSGLGREGAREGIRAFQETQYFSVDWTAP